MCYHAQVIADLFLNSLIASELTIPEGLLMSYLACHLHRSVQVGQFYHAALNSAPVAKIEWHPWGEAGSTLLVMTIDGKLRQDISISLSTIFHTSN